MGLLDTGQYVRPGQYQRPSLLDPNVMNLIQSGGPRVAPAPAAAPVQPARRGPGFLTYLMEGREGMERERMRPQMEAEREQKRQIMANLLEMFGGAGGAAGAGGFPAGAPDVPLQGAPAAPLVGGGQPGATVAPAPALRAMPSLREAAPILMAAELAGIDGMAGIRSTLEAVQPDIDFVNGMGVDRRDPTNVGRRVGVNLSNVNGTLADLNDPANANRFIPDIPEGAMPLYDDRGQIVAIRNIDGAVTALGERTRAVANANNASEASYAEPISAGRARGSAPYEFISAPSPTGAPRVMSKAAAAGQVFEGQTPADAIRAEGNARRDVATDDVSNERGRAAPERVARYEEALALIPKAITGFGADARLAGARVLAASGNQDAREAVAATEIYQNLIGRDIGPIVREMVGSANISNSDRELATRIAGGDTNITPQALTRIVNYELSRQTAFLAASGRPLTAAQARRLPRGTEFVGEDGQRYRVP